MSGGGALFQNARPAASIRVYPCSSVVSSFAIFVIFVVSGDVRGRGSRLQASGGGLGFSVSLWLHVPMFCGITMCVVGGGSLPVRSLTTE